MAAKQDIMEEVMRSIDHEKAMMILDNLGISYGQLPRAVLWDNMERCFKEKKE